MNASSSIKKEYFESDNYGIKYYDLESADKQKLIKKPILITYCPNKEKTEETLGQFMDNLFLTST